ncbi:Geranial dehydrogenase [Rhodococcus sp. T7]|nr:aldehyde dehydrogenase family protein [Rhodococcus sp. T7]KAF0963162.1 Geranial dehydrogenase [Rhodococcus sp. T7]
MAWQGKYTNLFIGGEWVEPATGDTIEVVSPFTERALAQIPAGSREDVDRAVRAAREAFDGGPWPRMSLPERMDVVRRFGKAITENRESIATLITEEMGCPITQTVASQSGAAIALIDTNLELVEQYAWRSVRRSNTGNALVTREPIGVVAAVVPWNAPLSVAMLKLVPALLAGCTVILKPSPEAPLSFYFLAEMVQAAGFPAGVVNVVTADRAESEYLVTHPGVNKVSFTGSTLAGRRIASLCGNDLRRYTLELGGKSAAIVLDDADLDGAVQSLRTHSFRYNGQACTNKTRIIVSRRREKDLTDRLAAMVEGLRVGDPFDQSTEIGPWSACNIASASKGTSQRDGRKAQPSSSVAADPPSSSAACSSSRPCSPTSHPI